MSLYTIPDNAQRTNTPSMYSNGDTEMVDAASAAAHAAQAHAHAHAQHYPPSRILSSVAVAPPSQRRTPHGTIAGSSGSMPRGHGQECSPADAHHQAALQHQSGPTPSTVANAHLGHSLYFIEHLFPSKLWRILDDAERCGYDHVISWVDSGMAFQIHDRESVIPILEKYFNMSKYKSFLRQLQAYDFRRALPNPKDDPNRNTKPKRDCYRGKWSHKLFRRDKMNLCNKMTRDGKTKQQDKDQRQQLRQQQQERRSSISSSSSSISVGSNSTSSSGSAAAKVNNAPLASKPVPAPGASSPVLTSAANPRNQAAAAAAVAAAAITKQQLHQQQEQYERQILQNQLMHYQQQQQQQQHHSSSGGPSPAPFHDPRYPQQLQQLQQYHQQLAHAPAAPSKANTNPNTYNGFPASSAVMAWVNMQAHQEEDERHRQQLTMQLNQIKEQQLTQQLNKIKEQQLNQLKEQQLIASILAARAATGDNGPAQPSGAAEGTRKATSPTLSPAPPLAAAAPSMLVGVKYSETKKETTSVAEASTTTASSAPGSPKLAPVNDAVSAAANELHQAELALIERRKRLIEAQEQAQQEAEAQAKVRVEATKVRAEAKLKVDEVEAAKMKLAECAAVLLNHHHLGGAAPPPTASTQVQVPTTVSSFEAGGGDPSGLNETANLPMSSLLQDLDNAFRLTASASATSSLTSVGRTMPNEKLYCSKNTIADSNANTNNDHKLTEEELQAGRIPIDHHIHTGNSSTSSSQTTSEQELLLARFNAMEQIRFREQQHQQQQLTSTEQQQLQQHLLLRLALAEREREERERTVLSSGRHGGSADVSISSEAVQDAIRNAALGLVTGHNNHANNNSISIRGRHSPHDLRHGKVVPPPSHLRGVGVGTDGSNDSRNSSVTTVPAPAAPLNQIAPGLLSQEMMDVFAKTAAAAISKKKEMINISPPATPPARDGTTSTLVTAPTSPSYQHPIPAAANKNHVEKSSIISSSSSIMKANDNKMNESAFGAAVTAAAAIKDSARISFSSASSEITSAETTNANTNTTINTAKKQKISPSDELEAARALMRIPGSVCHQSKGEAAVRGHWELVRPEELRADGPLSKHFPRAVTKLAELSSYDSYRRLALNMSPPQGVRIPDSWDPNKEPMYMVAGVANNNPSTQVLPSRAKNSNVDAAFAVGGNVHVHNGSTTGASGMAPPKRFL